MSFLIKELKECRDNSGSLDGQLLTMIGKGDIIDIALITATIAIAIAISVGIETLFDWYIRY